MIGTRARTSVASIGSSKEPTTPARTRPSALPDASSPSGTAGDQGAASCGFTYTSVPHPYLWLSFICPACQQISEIDLRTLDRRPNATIESLILSLSCRRCQPNPPFVNLLGLSKCRSLDDDPIASSPVGNGGGGRIARVYWCGNVCSRRAAVAIGPQWTHRDGDSVENDPGCVKLRKARDR
jgi:hypothetical protein